MFFSQSARFRSYPVSHLHEHRAHTFMATSCKITHGYGSKLLFW